MIRTHRLQPRRPVAICGPLLALAGLGLAATVHADPTLVEGLSGSGWDPVRVGYRCESLDCRFEAVLDTTLQGDVVEYEWRFDDGEPVTTAEAFAAHVWAEPGDHRVTLSVYDRYCELFVAEASFRTLVPESAPSGTDVPAGTDTAADADAPGAASPAVPSPLLSGASVRLGQDERRADAVALQGATLSGDAYVFVEALEGATEVAFVLSAPSLDARTIRVERQAPYDLGGGTVDVARAFDTRRFADGTYRLEVVASYADARTERAAVDFALRNDPEGSLTDAPANGAGTETVAGGSTGAADEPTSGAALPAAADAEASATTELVFSASADRRASESLAGATLGGRVYPYLRGAEGARSVRFFLDDPSLAGKPVQVERRAPWDAMGGTRRRANALDTSRLANGRHVLSAEIVDAGASYVVHAGFEVAN